MSDKDGGERPQRSLKPHQLFPSDDASQKVGVKGRAQLASPTSRGKTRQQAVSPKQKKPYQLLVSTVPQ